MRLKNFQTGIIFPILQNFSEVWISLKCKTAQRLAAQRGNSAVIITIAIISVLARYWRFDPFTKSSFLKILTKEQKLGRRKVRVIIKHYLH